MKSIAFTGHRPQSLGGFNILTAYNQRIITTIQRIIQQLLTQGYQQFICGGALGVDQWAANLVLLEKISNPAIKLTLALPFEGFDDVWPMASKRDLQAQVNQADEVFYISNPGYKSWKLEKSNHWMVHNAELIVAVWKGIEGGTAKCVRYAQMQNKPVIIYNPDTTDIIWP